MLDLGEVRKWFPNDPEFQKTKNGMLCILQHQQSRTRVVVGNCHLEHNPLYDHVKFAQAVLLLQKAAAYMRANTVGSTPFICGGDFNSLPISSVLSAFYNEPLTDFSEEASPSTWHVPAEFD